MVFLCPNIYCGQLFNTAKALSNHTRSQKCQNAKAEAKRHRENDQELGNYPSPSAGKQRRIENERELGNNQAQRADEVEGLHNQPLIPEVVLRFLDPIDLKLILLLLAVANA